MKTTIIYILTLIAATTGASAIGDWVVSSFAVPGDCGFPLGITYDGNYIYVSNGLGVDNVSEIYVLTDTGTEIDSYFVGNAYDVVAGLTYDGSSIWAVASTPGMIYEVNPGNGSIISSFTLNANNANPNSVAYYNGNLYVSNSTSSHSYIYVYNTSGSLQNTFMSHAKYPAGLDIIEHSGIAYIFNLGSDDGFFVLHETDGTVHPDYAYFTSSPDNPNYSGDVVFEQDEFSGGDPAIANMWHINKSDSNVYYLEVEWPTSGIKSASLGEIKAMFR